MGLIVGFVAVALVSAMYGIYRQVNVSLTIALRFGRVSFRVPGIAYSCTFGATA